MTYLLVTRMKLFFIKGFFSEAYLLIILNIYIFYIVIQIKFYY